MLKLVEWEVHSSCARSTLMLALWGLLHQKDEDEQH